MLTRASFIYVLVLLSVAWQLSRALPMAEAPLEDSLMAADEASLAETEGEMSLNGREKRGYINGWNGYIDYRGGKVASSCSVTRRVLDKISTYL